MTDLAVDSIVWETLVPVEGRQIRSTLRWYSKDPFAMHITFHDSEKGPIVWQFARDLLHSAFANEYSGMCDVKIAYQDDTIIIALSSDFEPGVTMKTPAAPIRDFLHRTYHIIPIGQEDTTPAIEHTLSQILGRT